MGKLGQRGERGLTGQPGPTGRTGPMGPAGNPGVAGDVGDDGMLFTFCIRSPLFSAVYHYSFYFVTIVYSSSSTNVCIIANIYKLRM